jgi:hypothetical protein
MGRNGYRIQLSNLVAGPELNGKKVRITTDLEKMREIEVPIKVIPAPPAPGAS